MTTVPPGSSLECRMQVPFAFQVHFTRDSFYPDNPILRDLLVSGGAAPQEKVLVVAERAVLERFPALAGQIEAYLSAVPGVHLAGRPLLLDGGEAVKNGREAVEQLYRSVDAHGLSRHSYLLAVGGGALLDAAGFAAATAHRGIRHIRFPTTTLSQADGGVGVKNAINAFGKKNFIGTFAPPYAVVNDSRFLQCLPEERKSDGYAEAVKVALIRDAGFFEEMEKMAGRMRAFEEEAMEYVIRRSARLHLCHIADGGDPFEFGSARPLDFGHWSAHKLEQMSEFRISHARAVAIGVALDTIYSRDAGYLSAEAADRILRLLESLGFSLYDPELSRTDGQGNVLVLEGLREFREHLGGRLTITLLRGIGQGFEVHEMDASRVRDAIRELKQRPPGRVIP